MNGQEDNVKKERLGIRLILKSVLFFVIFIAITFILAGRIDYWSGWLFNGLGIFFLIQIGSRPYLLSRTRSLSSLRQVLLGRRSISCQ